jgi:hypothetical protein
MNGQTRALTPLCSHSGGGEALLATRLLTTAATYECVALWGSGALTKHTTMSQSASQWTAFAREIARQRRVWTIRDGSGFPAPRTASGHRAHPFWSSRARAETIIRTVPAYADFLPYELSWEEFRDRWLPGLTGDGMKVGVNWSGPRATGYDLDPSEVLARIEHEIGRSTNRAP